jgi:hypothetical protein
MGKVYIASMNMRGKWAERPENTEVVNVTSAQGKNSINRLTFSPMTEINGGYKGYYCFENYWQAGKVFEGIKHEISNSWWKNLKEGKRRYPGSKGIRVLHSNYDGKIRNYLQSRKEIYVTEYYNLIKNKQQTKDLRKMVKSGKNIVIYDFDGPRDEFGNPICLEVTKDLLINKINDEKYPFGHGYVVAGKIAGIKLRDYLLF